MYTSKARSILLFPVKISHDYISLLLYIATNCQGRDLSIVKHARNSNDTADNFILCVNFVVVDSTEFTMFEKNFFKNNLRFLFCNQILITT